MTEDHWRVGSVDSMTWEQLYRHLDHGPNQPVLEYLGAGGDPNLRSHEFGATLLHVACFKGRREVVKALVAHGADLEAMSAQGFTPLASAAHKGHIGCVRALLAAGASTDCRPLGMSLVASLEYAQCKSAEVRRILIAASAASPSRRTQ